MKSINAKSLLDGFYEYLVSSKGKNRNGASSYCSLTRMAIKRINGDILPEEINFETINKAKEYASEHKLDKVMANSLSALKQLTEYMTTSLEEKKNENSPLLVRVSRAAFKAYLTSHITTNNTQLTPNTINDYASKLTRISKINIYSSWLTIESVYEALDRILDDTAFNEADHGGCKAALAIFIQCLEDIIAGKFQSADVQIAHYNCAVIDAK